MNHSRFLLTAAGIGLFTLAPLASAVSVIPSEADHVHSLDGAWRFKLEQGDMSQKPGSTAKQPIKLPDHFEPFEKLDYKEDASWHDFNVPGNWEMAGYTPATYGQPDNAIGLFRLEFDVPADWKGRIVKLNFDGVQNGAEVYLNGQPVTLDGSSDGKPNFHQGGYNPFQADLTPVVKFGEKNLLAIRVYKNTKGVELDTGDYFFLGGVHRPVTLFSIPKSSFDDLAVRTKVADANHADLQVLLHVASPVHGMKATMRLEGFPPVDGMADDKGNIDLKQALDHPKLWSAEHPNLYTLDVDLKNAAGETVEHVSKKIGVREVSIENGVFMVNHVPVKLEGICRHDLWPTVGSALGPEQWKQEITLMKGANINAIRTSHYPYGSGFYDLCDEMGMYVADEMAACWVPTDDASLAPYFAQHAREYVQRDKNHPSVVIWAVGNENRVGPNDGISAREIRKIDPTRPRLVSTHDSNATEDNVEFEDVHYPKPDAFAKHNAADHAKKIPYICLEGPNVWDVRNGADWGSLDLWAAVMDREWKEIWKDEHVAGSFLWEWQDRAVADKCPTKLYDYDAKTGINLLKVKGITGAYRDIRPDYYAVKVAYAPIDVDLKPDVRADAVVVHANNRFSFTNLADINTTWHLMSDGKDLKSDTIHPSLAPVKKGDVQINLPGDALAKADVLRLNFAYPDGRDIVTYDLRLKPEAGTSPRLNTHKLADVKFPHFNFDTTNIRPKNSMWQEAVRHWAKLTNIKVQMAGGTSKTLSDEAELYNLPLASVHKLQADFILADDKQPKTAGRVEATYDNGKFSYRVTWLKSDSDEPAAKGKAKRRNPNGADVQECGWTFEMPAAADHFSWHRKGYWSYYPDDYIGRIAGTATPDSADQDITRITRPDAFDFNSTKYACDWAMLADTNGNGIAIKSVGPDHQNCRAGTAEDGSRQLVVNKQCSPPRDISSSVVPDFYLTLHEGQKVESSFEVGEVGK